MALPPWLPPLAPFDGDWNDVEKRDAYIDQAYQQFAVDFLGAQWDFRGRRVFVWTQPLEGNKASWFWHLISEAPTAGADRQIDYERCARISWPRAVLEAPETELRIWRETARGGRPSVAVAVGDFEYIVFLEERPDSYRLKSAYLVTRPVRREKFRREWEAGQI